MDQIRVRRETLAEMMRSHGEDDLAERALSVTDDELKCIRERGAHYVRLLRASARVRLQHGGRKSIFPAMIDVLEGAPRELRWTRTKVEREMGWPDDLSNAELTRDRSLRQALDSSRLLHTPDLATKQLSRVDVDSLP